MKFLVLSNPYSPTTFAFSVWKTMEPDTLLDSLTNRGHELVRWGGWRDRGERGGTGGVQGGTGGYGGAQKTQLDKAPCIREQYRIEAFV